MAILQIMLMVLGPWAIFAFEKRFTWARTLGSVVLCYALGLILGNLFSDFTEQNISKQLTEITVPLAIPLLLINCNLLLWVKQAKTTVLSFIIMLFSVLVVTTSTTFIFSTPHLKEISAMLVGVYTGGTPNLTAIGMALNVPEESFILVNAADVIIGGVYFLLLLAGGAKVLAFWLPVKKVEAYSEEEVDCTRITFKSVLMFVLLALGCMAIAVGLSLLIFEEMSVPFIILFLTTSGVALSFIEKLRQNKAAMASGNYLLLIFCIAIGSMANVQDLANQGLEYLGLVSYVMIGAIFLHFFLCRFFNIDRDTAIITSVAGIYGPAFVGPVSQALHNPGLVLSGMSSGLVGYAIGNYLGLFLFWILSSWF